MDTIEFVGYVCDRCRKPAQVRVTTVDKVIYLCGEHHEAHLKESMKK